MGQPISPSVPKPLFVQGALYTLPQTHGKEEFRLVSPSGDSLSLPYVSDKENSSLRRLCHHHSHQYRVVEDQGDAYVLQLVEASWEMADHTAPQMVILRGEQADKLRRAIADPQRY